MSKPKNLQKLVCREIIDTQDVIKGQVANVLASELRSEVDDEKLRKLTLLINSSIQTQTSSLLDRVIEISKA